MKERFGIRRRPCGPTVGLKVTLRLPGLAVGGSEAEQLGLGTPQFQDLPLSPAVWRKLGSAQELLVGAKAVSTLMGSQAVTSAEDLFAGAVGVVVADVLYQITRCEALLVAGAPCAYRLRVAEPIWP